MLTISEEKGRKVDEAQLELPVGVAGVLTLLLLLLLLLAGVAALCARSATRLASDRTYSVFRYVVRSRAWLREVKQCIVLFTSNCQAYYVLS